MSKGLAILAVLGLSTWVAPADEVVEVFYPTRDASITRALREEYASGGILTQCRIVVSRQHFLLMDFDWAAMKAFVDSYPGWTATFELGLTPSDDRLGDYPVTARIVMIGNDVDWVEGDGNSQFTNFCWTDPTVNPAVTGQYAQTYEDPLNPGNPDLARCIGPWPGGDFDAFRNTSGYYDSGGIVFGPYGVRAWEPLDGWFMDQIFSGFDIDGRPIRGIYTYDSDSMLISGEAYTSDAGQDKSPVIRVTLVPEPGALALLGIGGLALLRRKRGFGG